MAQSPNCIGIIGAGTMGNGIAQVCAMAGLNVRLLDIDDAALKRGTDNVTRNLDRLVAKEKLTAAARDEALARITTGLEHEALSTADIVIEAATENLELKLKTLRQVAKSVRSDAIIATNTSSISITQLGAVLDSPERFIGIHFFNPVPLMSLLEVIRGVQTSDATHAATMEFARKIGKSPITVRNSPGFVVNRILCPMINEAIFVLQEGLATAEDIDAGMRLGCNHPIGPLALADMIGLDTLLAIMRVLYDEFCDPKYRPASLLKEMVVAGCLGRKTKQGFYQYS